MPNVALIPPIAVATRWCGKVSRMIPKASGKIPPPAPCTTRPRIITGSEVASAETTVPAPSTTRMHTSTRSLPWMSPRRPRTGVATDALTR
jgi:hypothetical protein